MHYTLDGFTYFRVSDLATVKESMILDFEPPGTGDYLSVFINVTYAPPLNDFDFPLKEGDVWSSTSSVTISMDIVSSVFPSSSTSTTVSMTTEFEVESKETVDVSAGKFSTYVIEATEVDGMDYLWLLIVLAIIVVLGIMAVALSRRRKEREPPISEQSESDRDRIQETRIGERNK